MASFNNFFFFFLVHALLLLPNTVLTDNDDENTLLQGINSFRQSHNLPALVKNDKADCLADRIAEELEDKLCTAFVTGSMIVPATTEQITQLPNYQKSLQDCKIDVGSTAHGVIMSVCVRKLVPTLVLTNFTQSPFVRYLNRSEFTGAGLGSEDDWMVVVLSTSTPNGSFTGPGALKSASADLGCFLLPLILGLFFSLALVVLT